MAARRDGSKAASTHAIVSAQHKIGASSFSPQKHAPFIQSRLELFHSLSNRQREADKAKKQEPIQIKLPDGAMRCGISNETTPLDVALEISKGLAESVVVAKVKYNERSNITNQLLVAADQESENFKEEESDLLWDLTRPLEASCSLNLLKFSDPEGKSVFWHSSAHVLGQCLEQEFGAQLTIGPSLSTGFYYDCYMGDFAISQEHYETLQNHAAAICKANQPFERLVVSKSEALELFKDNPFKVKLIESKVPDGSCTSCYRCGPLIDLCRGPHLPSTGRVKAFAVTKHSAAYWLGCNNLDSLQRTYAVAFPDTKQLREYLTLIGEAKKRDHRVLGNQMELFFFDTNVSAGSCFWLKEGAKLYNKLCNFIRNEYRLRGFDEVISPNIYSCDLWKTSGHYQNYKENMYLFEIEGREWGLKPMNCPGHCCIFKHINPSYKQLPLRMADFGVLHRNEISGSLSGLTRVRRFQQDDAHIFCTSDQIKSEVQKSLEFLFYVYKCFGFSFELQLSTRPAKSLGSPEQWNSAEKALEEALDESGVKWTLNPGDGAFYGPKVDIKLYDALKRGHQCGTIQLDFQLPQRFNLQYRTQEEAVADAGKAQTEPDVEGQLRPGCLRPVMIHRAILGSVERMIAVLIEHSAGKFPFWLSPRQAIVLPISEKFDQYAHWLSETLHNHGFDVGLDKSNNTINKKIREAQLLQWNYMLVVGELECSNGTVTVRSRDSPKNQVTLSVTDLIAKFDSENMPTSRPLRNFEPWTGVHKRGEN